MTNTTLRIVCFFAVLSSTHNFNSAYAASVAIQDTLKVSTDFESGSAHVLELNSEMQTIRITPNGNPKHGWPNWWYLQLTHLDSRKPVTLEVVPYVGEVFTDNRGETRALAADWSLPERRSEERRVGKECRSRWSPYQ